jgi:hypothetical protein
MCRDCGGSQLCKNVECASAKNTKYKGFCATCFYKHPDNASEVRVINSRVKEDAVAKFIMKRYGHLTWRYNKGLFYEQRKQIRPDALLERETHIIVVEVDENQHISYTDEDLRETNLRSCFTKPVVIIRFNPDGYSTPSKNRQKSPWVTRRDTRLVELATERLVDWNARLEKLAERICAHLDNPPESHTTEVLYYDT